MCAGLGAAQGGSCQVLNARAKGRMGRAVGLWERGVHVSEAIGRIALSWFALLGMLCRPEGHGLPPGAQTQWSQVSRGGGLC